MPENMNETPETLFGLVKAYSPTGQEKPAVDFLVKRMQDLGFNQAFADEAGNAVGVLGAGPRQVVLLGHIDTVPGEIPVQVVPSPLSPLPGGDGPILYGRGSVDAKGPLATFTDAVAGVGSIEGWQFVVIGAVGEEGNSPGAQFVAPRYQPEFAIIGEPSRWDRITLGYKGSAWMKITVRRSLAHTAGQGESACEAAVKIWEAIRDWAAAFNAGRPRAFDQVLPTLRGLDSGGDGFEEWASLRVGTRLPVDLPPDAWYTQLNQIPGVAGIPGLSLERLGFPIPAYQGEKNTPLVRAFLAGIRAEGGQPGFLLKTGTADLNIVAPAWGCPALAYGPGDSSLDHTPHEHLALEEYRRAVGVLKETLTRLCKGFRAK
ncbi:MAG TPA: [LysW]-lysine hydrolase [Anaerolineales bacterium]|nr:[LysW]-lysine hydrolase [Anaerolineales bacterium]